MEYRLIKIGSLWAFDINTYIGYVNTAENESDPPELEEAFRVTKGENNSNNISFYKEIPLGVVRRSLHLIDMVERGILVE